MNPSATLHRHPRARRIAAAFALSAAAVFGQAAAHDFWIQPDAYWTRPGAATPLTLQVGHGPDRQRSPLPASRITRFDARAPDGTTIDLRATLHPGGERDDGTLRFAAPGLYVVALATDHRAQSHLPALRFNDYLRAEGLTPAIDARMRAHRIDVDGSERYGRRAKALLQVGAPDAASQAQATAPIGLTLEIVPDVDPYAVPRTELLPVRVLYEGRPLPGALVKLTDLEHDGKPVAMHRTDAAGRAFFDMPARGQWQFNVIWTKPLPNTEETDFDTVLSSLSFGFADAAR